MTKKVFFGLIVLMQSFFALGVDVQVQAYKHEKVKLLVCTTGRVNKTLKRIAQRVQKDLGFTKQFAVSYQHVSKVVQQRDVKHFFSQGFPLVLFIKKGKGKKFIEWRLYDTQNASMLVGKNYCKRGKNFQEWSHHIVDAVWPIATGQPGFFSTKIAYCKEVKQQGKKVLKHVYIADFDGGNEKLLVSTSTVNVAPRWNRDGNRPLLFYSEHTNENVRLVMVDMHGRRKVVSNFDGINMLPAFSSDGKRVVFCASRGSGNCQLYFFQKGRLKKLTHNHGNNICPTFSQDGKTLFFCSDFETKGPQIYRYDFETKKQERITHGGYCVSPSYCAQNNKLAYAKMIRGIMQMFVHDLKTNKHQQVTFDAGNKEECSWSPCGNYLLFAVEKRNESRLALLNLNSSDRQFITSRGSMCCYPAWSCPYNNFAAA